jgi:hypothetical protein
MLVRAAAVLHRVVTAGILALGAGIALAETPAQDDSTNHVGYVAGAVSGATNVPRGVDFNGVVFPLDTDVADDIDLTQVDGAVFYELSGAATALEVGMALRLIDGVVELTAADYGRWAQFDGVLPLAYARLRLDLPWSTFYSAVQAKAYQWNRDEMIDATMLLGWASNSGVAVEAGYRHYRLRLVDYDQLEQLDVDLSGPYAMLSLRF